MNVVALPDPTVVVTVEDLVEGKFECRVDGGRFRTADEVQAATGGTDGFEDVSVFTATLEPVAGNLETRLVKGDIVTAVAATVFLGDAGPA